jgi:hypothetical protein
LATPQEGSGSLCKTPDVAGGTIPGGFFRWPEACESAWRWDPIARRDDRGQALPDWVAWPLPAAAQPSLGKRLVAGLQERLVRVFGGGSSNNNEDEGRRDAATKGPEDSKDEAEDEHKTAAQAAAELYSKSIERHRDAVKWLVVAAGAVATAVVGTAPLAGLAQAIPRPGGGWAVGGFLVLLGSVTAILVTVALIFRPAGTSTAELGSDPSIRGTWTEKKWLKHMQAEYESAPALFLDAKVRTLAEFRDYRAAWRGVVADINRHLLAETSFDRNEKLQKYADAAAAQLRADDESIAVNIQRGILEIIRQRATLTLRIVVGCIIVAILGFAAYLYGIGVSGHPTVESVTASPNEVTSGQDLAIRAIVTGDKLTFEWKHDSEIISPTDDGFSGADGPVLRIQAADVSDSGEYRLTVTDEDEEADSKTIQVTVAPLP